MTELKDSVILHLMMPGNCRRIASENADSICISVITLYELEYGYANAPDEKRSILRQKITEACQDFEVLSLSVNGSRLFGELKKLLRDYRGLKNLFYPGDCIMYAVNFSEEFRTVFRGRKCFFAAVYFFHGYLFSTYQNLFSADSVSGPGHECLARGTTGHLSDIIFFLNYCFSCFSRKGLKLISVYDIPEINKSRF